MQSCESKISSVLTAIVPPAAFCPPAAACSTAVSPAAVSTSADLAPSKGSGPQAPLPSKAAIGDLRFYLEQANLFLSQSMIAACAMDLPPAAILSNKEEQKGKVFKSLALIEGHSLSSYSIKFSSQSLKNCLEGYKAGNFEVYLHLSTLGQLLSRNSFPKELTETLEREILAFLQ